jgi:hypothetical protein
VKSGSHHTPESRARISVARQGSRHSDETRRRIAAGVRAYHEGRISRDDLEKATECLGYVGRFAPAAAAGDEGAAAVVRENLRDALEYVKDFPEVRALIERAAALATGGDPPADDGTKFDVTLGRRRPRAKADKRRTRPDGVAFPTEHGLRGIDLRPRADLLSSSGSRRRAHPGAGAPPPSTERQPVRTDDAVTGGIFPCGHPSCPAMVEVHRHRAGEPITCAEHADWTPPVRGLRLNPKTMGVVGDPALEEIEEQLEALDQTRAALIRRREELAKE